ncbi:MAG TPA: hypothetical protein VIC85_11940 [Ktedonobacterales bacterium]|jgi:hypothetical protein
MRRWTFRRGLILAILGLSFMACTTTTIPVGPVVPGSTPTPCTVHCPPPARAPVTGHPFQNKRFTLRYYDPFTVVKHDDNSVVLGYVNQDTGNTFEVTFVGEDVPSGTSAQQLLTAAEKNLDTSQLSGVQDLGPIYGAEVGYVAGAGDIIAGTEDLPNAPSSPVVLELMASTHGGTGILFLAASTINPNTRNPGALIRAANSHYDLFVNSVAW